jgi:pullulanase-type alpha-1,6-glucosidase
MTPVNSDDICNAPASTVLIAVPPGGGETPARNVRVHYHRADGVYPGWGLHVWQLDDAGQFLADYPGVAWTQPLTPTELDDYGPIFQIEAGKITNAQATGFGFIVHQGDTKDPDGDRAWQFRDGDELWLLSGDPAIYRSNPLAALDRQDNPPIAAALPGARSTSTTDARAVWLSASLLRWPRVDAGGAFRLYHSATGQIVALPGAPVSGADGALSLTVSTAALPAPIAERFRFVGDGVTLALADPGALDAVLTGQLVVVQQDAGGNVLGATTAQLAGLLDDRFHAATSVSDLGVSVTRDRTRFRVWAPTAQRVALCTYGARGANERAAMTRDRATGVWSAALPGDRSGQYYRYAVEVFVRGVGVVRNLVTDPYSISLDANSQRSYIADLDEPRLKPHGWDRDQPPATAARQQDMTIYELHVRDFSASDATVPAQHRGKYLAFTHRESAGMRHLRGLARAGLTDVHLLPIFDLASVPEVGCVDPVIPDAGPDSDAQQAAVAAVRDQDCFNWGYDPLHYTAPEGSYATDPGDGASRIRELRAMVMALHDAGLRVGMDVVYNHTSASGQSDTSVLDRIVPGYYHRLSASGDVEHATCCENTAAENLMMGKLMIDSVVTWATQYNIDSFRFDLMSFHPRATMEALKAEVEARARRDVFIIGEGWNFGEVADGARFVQASQLSLGGSGIATFSDRARDFIRGGGPFDGGQALVQNQGFVNGLFYDDNGSGGGKTRADLMHAADLVKVGLAGSLRNYRLRTASDEILALSQIDYNGQPAGYVTAPDEVVNYMENHDNQTLFDNNVYKLPLATSREDRARVQILAAALTAFSQGVAYFHAGVDVLRSKSMDRNSFNSGDWFNRLDWSYGDNGFGAGLPLAGDNADNWPIIKPLLANPAIKPTSTEIRWTRDAFRDLLEIRASEPVFHLRSAADIEQRLAFYNTGSQQEPTVIAGHIDGRGVGRGLRNAGTDDLIYFVNVDKVAHALTIDAEKHKPYRLHPVHRRFDAADQRPAAGARYDRATGTFTIPPRTAVVFVAD